MANVLPPMSSGIDLDWSGLGSAISVAIRRASGKSPCKEITRGIAVVRETKE
jgi:hypothetical protein